MKEKFTPLLTRGFVSVFEHTPTGYTIVRATDAIAILVEVAGKGVLMVRQERPAMITEKNPQGMLTEVIAGRFDCNLSPKALAVKEIEEEAGISVSEDQIEILNGGKPLAVGPGLISDRIYLAYANIRPNQVSGTQTVFGKPEEQEQTLRVFFTIKQLETMRFEDLKTYALVQYFLKERAKGDRA